MNFDLSVVERTVTVQKAMAAPNPPHICLLLIQYFEEGFLVIKDFFF